MSVRGKFFIQSVKLVAGTNGGGSVELNVVSRGAENASWSAATPSGAITMHVSNPSAFAFFKENLGKEVYVDMALADPKLVDPREHEFVLFEQEGHYGSGKCLHCGMEEKYHGEQVS